MLKHLIVVSLLAISTHLDCKDLVHRTVDVDPSVLPITSSSVEKEGQLHDMSHLVVLDFLYKVDVSTVTPDRQWFA